jgi:hypothetical protein
MKKALFMVLFLTFILNAYSQNEFQFGNYQWGTTIDVIEMNEGTPDDATIIIGVQRAIFYNNKFFQGYPVNKDYYFYENRLELGIYTFTDIYTLERCIEIFTDLNSLYGGDDVQNEIIKIRESYSKTIRNNKKRKAQYRGLIYNTSWYYEDTEIKIQICYQNIYEINIQLLYFSLNNSNE